jgi:hypothetical protein
MMSDSIARSHLLAVGIALLPLGVEPVSAQSMRPLTELVESDDPAVGAYVLRRCAGLYRVFELMWQSDQPELAARFQESLGTFLLAATQRATDLGTPDARGVTFAEVQAIVDVYVERALRNRALTGDYFAQDPLMSSDGELCRDLLEILSPPAGD